MIDRTKDDPTSNEFAQFRHSFRAFIADEMSSQEWHNSRYTNWHHQRRNRNHLWCANSNVFFLRSGPSSSLSVCDDRKRSNPIDRYEYQ